MSPIFDAGGQSARSGSRCGSRGHVPSFGEACASAKGEEKEENLAFMSFAIDGTGGSGPRTPSTRASAYLMSRLPPSSVSPSCPHCHGRMLGGGVERAQLMAVCGRFTRRVLCPKPAAPIWDKCPFCFLPRSSEISHLASMKTSPSPPTPNSSKMTGLLARLAAATLRSEHDTL